MLQVNKERFTDRVTAEGADALIAQLRARANGGGE
jgi:hypothetical protein